MLILEVKQVQPISDSLLIQFSTGEEKILTKERFEKELGRYPVFQEIIQNKVFLSEH